MTAPNEPATARTSPSASSSGQDRGIRCGLGVATFPSNATQRTHGRHGGPVRRRGAVSHRFLWVHAGRRSLVTARRTDLPVGARSSVTRSCRAHIKGCTIRKTTTCFLFPNPLLMGMRCGKGRLQRGAEQYSPAMQQMCSVPCWRKKKNLVEKLAFCKPFCTKVVFLALEIRRLVYRAAPIIPQSSGGDLHAQSPCNSVQGCSNTKACSCLHSPVLLKTFL